MLPSFPGGGGRGYQPPCPPDKCVERTGPDLGFGGIGGGAGETVCGGAIDGHTSVSDFSYAMDS